MTTLIATNEPEKSEDVGLAKLLEIEKVYFSKRLNDKEAFGTAQLDADTEKEVVDLLATSNLEKKPMILYHQCFRFGFKFYYGELSGQQTLIPVEYHQGWLIRNLIKEKKSPWFPLKNPLEGGYFLPEVTEVKHLPPPSGSCPSWQYLSDLVRHVKQRIKLLVLSENDFEIDRQFRILQVLPFSSPENMRDQYHQPILDSILKLVSETEIKMPHKFLK